MMIPTAHQRNQHGEEGKHISQMTKNTKKNKNIPKISMH